MVTKATLPNAGSLAVESHITTRLGLQSTTMCIFCVTDAHHVFSDEMRCIRVSLHIQSTICEAWTLHRFHAFELLDSCKRRAATM